MKGNESLGDSVSEARVIAVQMGSESLLSFDIVVVVLNKQNKKNLVFEGVKTPFFYCFCVCLNSSRNCSSVLGDSSSSSSSSS